MMIPLFKIHWDEDDIKSVNEAIKLGMYWAIGPNIEKFENLISEYIGSEYAVTFNSGTSALHATLLAHGIGPGDEVIVPSFTFIATANAVLMTGATPVFADIEKETLGMDPKDAENKITKKTKVILPIHYGGCPCKVNELKELADRKSLILIEDAAEAFGAKIGSKKVATFGHSSTLSFCSNKIISTGEGGATVTNDKSIYEKLKLLRSHGRLEKTNYFSTSHSDYVSMGYNFRMSNITAALGISQIKKADKIIKKRRENANYMIKGLRKINSVKLLDTPKNYFHVYQMLTILAGRRDGLIDHLSKNGILSKVFFDPVHKTKFYKKYSGAKLPVTDAMSKKALTLPLYPDMTKEEMDTIIESTGNFR